MKHMTAVLLLFCLSTDALAGTACDEWANFTKIITFRFRDTGKTETEVKEELKRVMKGNTELDIALDWISYTYKHQEMDARSIWEGVYSTCSKQ